MRRTCSLSFSKSAMQVLSIAVLFFFFHQLTLAQNLLVNGNFELGGAGPGFNTNYFLASTPGTSFPREYNILANPYSMNNAFFSNATDHTFGNGTGKMMVVDGSGNAGDKVWELVNGGSIGVQSGRTYIFSYWIRSISASNDASNSAIIKVYTNGTTSAPVLIAGSQTCPIGNPSSWVQVSYTWTATTNNAQIWLTDEQTNGGGAGNDFALDDLTLVEDNGPLSLRYCYNGPACPGSTNAVLAAWGRGGVPPYFFSLNNSAFQPLSVFALSAPSAGNELRIIDSKSPVPDTAFSLPPSIDIPAAANKLTISNDTSICNTAPVNLTASGGSNYVWTANTASNVANLSSSSGAVVTATPSATTIYTVTSDVPSVNLISNPGFENGDSSFYTDYTFYTATTNQQAYGINGNAQLFDASFSACTAHNPGGKMMVVDGATSARQVWSQVVSVTPNTDYTFSFYIQTVALPVPAQINVSINGQVLGVAAAPPATCNWVAYSYTWNSGIATLAYISLANITTATNGNDFALDDISFTTVCANVQKSVTVTVGNLAAPVVAVTQPGCITNTGSITVTSTATGVTYSFDNGVSFQSSPVSPPLAANTSIQVVVKDAGGCTSAATSVTINAAPSPLSTPLATPTQPGCTVTTGSITVTSPAGIHIVYSINGVSYQGSNIFNLLAAATYNVTAKDTVTGCVSPVTPVVINTAPALPPVPTLNIVQPTCAVATGTITITNPQAGNIYSFDNGVTFQNAANFTATAGITYQVVIKNAAGCLSAATAAQVTTAPALPPAPTLNIIQPSCTVASGTITITNPQAGNTYSFDNGVTFQNAANFTATAGITYQVVIKNAAGCLSIATPAVVNSVSAAPAAPILNIIQPGCTVATGTITITNPQAGNTYSFDNGVTFQNAANYTATAGITYQVVVKNAAGCISTAAPAVVNNIPTTPPAPTLSVTQPTCIVTTGTISITNPQAGDTYSFDNGVTFQNAANFTATAGITYQVLVKNAAGCISTATPAIVNNVPTAPPAPTFNVTQPTCIATTGSVTILSPGGVNYFFSIGGVNYQPGALFSGLVPASYSVFVKDTGTGCVSLPSVVIIDAVPSSPQAPTLSTVINNDCANSTVSVTITSPTGPAYIYSKDGTNYQPGILFSNLPAGNYNFTVKDNITGCISSPLGYSYSGGSNTAPPSVTDTIVYCQGAAAAPLTATGQNLQWYDLLTGGLPSPSAPLPSTAVSDTTIYYVTQTLFACESSRVPITVIVNSVPVLPTVTTPVLYCQGENAAALSPSGINYSWYTTASGGSGVNSLIPSTASAGAVNYYVSENSNGCEGPRAQLTVQVNAAPVLGADKLINICAGEAINLTTQYSTPGFTIGYFLNNSAVANPSAVTENGEYLITASAGNGCDDSATILLIVRPPVPVFAGNDFTTAAGQPAQLTAQGGGDFFQWNVLQPSAGVVLSNQSAANAIATFSEGTSILQVMIMDDIGCIGYDTLVVTANALWQQVYVPNAFSPNNDPRQLNETFKPSAQSIRSIKYFRIFNRYGQVVFETNKSGNGWDGTYQGKPQPVGNYIWVLSCINAAGREVNLKGNVMIIR